MKSQYTYYYVRKYYYTLFKSLDSKQKRAGPYDYHILVLGKYEENYLI